MPEQGKLAKCSCSKCSRSGNGLGYCWVSTETARLHAARDTRQAWIKERNRRIEAQRLEPGPSATDQGREINGIHDLDAQLPPPHSRDVTPILEDPPSMGPLPLLSPHSPRSPSPAPSLDPEGDRVETDITVNLFPEIPPAAGDQNNLEIEYGPGEHELMYCAGYDAAKDPPYLRLAYLSAVESSIIHHNSVTGVNAWLSAHIASLRIAGALPEDITPAFTLDGVQSRLGLDTDSFMLKQPICSICYTPYSMDQILLK
ncbi:hypothetical protein RSAG8_11766, partial [Rhizoctonia solani AG-8 WAC10335]